MPLIPLVLASLISVSSVESPYIKYEETLTKMDMLKSLNSYDPEFCTVSSNITKNSSKKCSHVIVGDMSGAMIFQIFMDSPYNSFFIITGGKEIVNSEYEYKVERMIFSKNMEYDATGTCIENVLSPPITMCNVKYGNTSFKISYDSGSPRIVK